MLWEIAHAIVVIPCWIRPDATVGTRNRRFVMFSTWQRLAAPLAAAAALALTGCACYGDPVEIIDMQTDTFAIPSDAAQSALIKLDLGIGELSIEGGSQSLCSAELRYNVAEWKPVIEQHVDGTQAVISVTQPSLGDRSVGDQARTYWKLEISDDVPAHLVLDIGVGESHINLADALVEQLDIDAGVGEVVIDIARVRRDLAVDVESGVGSVAINVPDDVGVRVDCDRGIGSFHYSGLTRTRNGYVNAAYGTSGSQITITIDSGVGDVRVGTRTITAGI
jgi:hypothetical protein